MVLDYTMPNLLNYLASPSCSRLGSSWDRCGVHYVEPIEGAQRPPQRASAAYICGSRMPFKARSHNRSGLRSPVFASSMILFAIACLTSSSQSPVRRAMQTCSSATPRIRLVSGSKRWPLRNWVIGMASDFALGALYETFWLFEYPVFPRANTGVVGYRSCGLKPEPQEVA